MAIDKYNRGESVRVAKQLVDAVGGDASKIPQDWADQLTVSYTEPESEGRENWLNLLPKMTGVVTESTLQEMAWVDPSKLPPQDYVESLWPESFSEAEEADFSEFFQDDSEDFAEEGLSGPKMTKFLKAVIETVYLDGIDNVVSMTGEPPSEANNYLLNEDGTKFEGQFNDAKKVFTFVISEDEPEQWSIMYQLKDGEKM
jgi:hypothetical protein